VSRTPASAYVVGPLYDWLFFLSPPLVCLGLGALVSSTSLVDAPLSIAGRETHLATLVVGVFIHAHLAAVFLRSHGDRTRLRAFPVRFLVVPPLLFAAIASSRVVAITATVVAAFWDVYHSGAQTFGFARLYDQRAGNPPDEGRRLDFVLNQLLYAGPILGGATLFEHLSVLESFDEVGLHALADLPAAIDSHAATLARATLLGGLAFVALYVLAYARLHARGHVVAWPKVFLVASTGLVSIATWTFDPFGVAFLVMNLFHAIQYLALIWVTDARPTARATAERLPVARALALYLVAVFAYGTWAELVPPRGGPWALTLVVSLLHFWYDGFLWSVRKRDVLADASVATGRGAGGRDTLPT